MLNVIKLFTIVLIISHTLFAWGKTGHRIEGEIAEKYLTKNAKAQIKRLIGHHNLSRISVWADEIKSDPNWKHANDWHWCTVPDDEEYIKGFNAPFVKESKVKIGMQLVEEKHIDANDTILIVGEVKNIIIDK